METQTEIKDVVLTEEKNYICVNFITEKAKLVLDADHNLSKGVYQDGINPDQLKIDIAYASKKHMIDWLVQHDLTTGN
jgi:hypothetical protein